MLVRTNRIIPPRFIIFPSFEFNVKISSSLPHGRLVANQADEITRDMRGSEVGNIVIKCIRPWRGRHIHEISFAATISRYAMLACIRELGLFTIKIN